jgi:hypothetical protein
LLACLLTHCLGGHIAGDGDESIVKARALDCEGFDPGLALDQSF